MKSHILQLVAHVLLLSAMSASAAIRYVNVNSANPVPPYTNWATASTTIQEAVDAAVAGDQILVTNGVYQTGGRAVFGSGPKGFPNRVAVTKPLVLRSVNGAAATVIQDDDGVRCVYLTNDAALVGFTLTNGVLGVFGRGAGVWCDSASATVSDCVLAGNSVATDGSGGGANGGTLTNCTLMGNSATDFGRGGGAAFSTLNNCTLTGNLANLGGGVDSSMLNNCRLTGNMATEFGGGARASTLNNCTLTANSASGSGGGAHESTLNNCIDYYNSAPQEANYSGSSLSYSCTTRFPRTE